MYQGDTRKHEAQPQEEEEEICPEGEMKNLGATIQENDESILDLTKKLNLELTLRSENDAKAKQTARDDEMDWQLQFSALMETDSLDESSESILKSTLLKKDEAIRNLTRKVNLEMKLRSEIESKANVLHSDMEYLENQVRTLADDLKTETEVARANDMGWQLRYMALEENNKKDKLSEENLRLTIQEKEEAILKLTEKLNLEIKLRSDAEVLNSDKEYLKNQVESLAKVLEAQTKQGEDNDMAWQLRFSALEKGVKKKEKSSESNLRLTIQEKEEAILDLTEKLQLVIKERSDGESKVKVLHSNMGYLEVQVAKLTKDLDAQTKLGQDKDKVWHTRLCTLVEETSKKEKASELSSKTLLSEYHDRENKIQSLTEDLKTQTKLVRDSAKAWKAKIKTMKREHTLKEKIMQAAADAERKGLLQKLKEQTRITHLLQIQCQVQSDREEEFQSQRRQILHLEDICLRQKKKNLGLFGRRMGDREVELERMKRKVPAREPVDPPSPVRSDPPVYPPSLVYSDSPVHPPTPVCSDSPVDPPTPVYPHPTVYRPSLVDWPSPIHSSTPVNPRPPVPCPPRVKWPRFVDWPSPIRSSTPVNPPPPDHYPPSVSCPSLVNSPPPVHSPPSVLCRLPVDPPSPVLCPSAVDPPSPVLSPSPVNPPSPVHLSYPSTSNCTDAILKVLSHW